MLAGSEVEAGLGARSRCLFQRGQSGSAVLPQRASQRGEERRPDVDGEDEDLSQAFSDRGPWEPDETWQLKAPVAASVSAGAVGRSPARG
jgi:hypothetical protein